jgi:hypothetical protein
MRCVLLGAKGGNRQAAGKLQAGCRQAEVEPRNNPQRIDPPGQQAALPCPLLMMEAHPPVRGRQPHLCPPPPAPAPRRPIPQVTKEEVEAEKERLRAVDARPIKKV